MNLLMATEREKSSQLSVRVHPTFVARAHVNRLLVNRSITFGPDVRTPPTSAAAAAVEATKLVHTTTSLSSSLSTKRAIEK